MSFFNEVWDNAIGGVLRKPLKKALGVSDMQLAGLTAAAVAAPYALPALGASGAAGAAGAAEGAAGGATAAAAPAEAGFSTYLGNAGKLATIGQASGLLNQQQQTIQGAQLSHQAPQFAGLLTQPQDDTDMRRQAYNQRIQGLLGGSYGRFA